MNGERIHPPRLNFRLSRPGALILFGLAIIGVIEGYWLYKQQQPTYVTGWDVPDAAKLGHVAAAMQQSRQLLAGMKANHWVFDPNVIPIEMMLLPDRKFAEDGMWRSNRQLSYATPTDGSLYQNVAFFTEIYARQNRTHYKGSRETANPTGFWIVGWKHPPPGHQEVEQIPVEQIGLCRDPANGTDGPCFPGIPGYDPKHRWPFYVKK